MPRERFFSSTGGIQQQKRVKVNPALFYLADVFIDCAFTKSQFTSDIAAEEFTLEAPDYIFRIRMFSNKYLPERQ